MRFKNRSDAGKQLATKLESYKKEAAVVLGLARGGIVIAYEIAKALKAPLDIVFTRKIGSPISEELAIGAITETGEGYFDERLMEEMGVVQDYIDRVVAREKEVAKKRLSLYRKSCPKIALKEKTVILVDDGIATGSTMKAAIIASKKQHPKKIIIAVPIAAKDAEISMKPLVDNFIALTTPTHFYGISEFYEDFHQVTDEEILKLLGELNV